MPSMIPNVRKFVHLYIFVSILFVVGVIFGAILVNSLSLEQQEELSRQIGQVFINIQAPIETSTFWSALWMYWRWIMIIAVLGISIIGFPLVLAVDFVKGVLVGFAVGTLVSQYSWKGAVVALAAVAPQNMIAIPFLLMASVASIAFALHVLKHRLLMPKLRSLKQPFMDYALAQAGSGIGLIGVAAFVTWVSPHLMSLVSFLIVK